MRTLITGGSGLIGSALIEFLHGRGHDIRCLKRVQDDTDTAFWNTAPLTRKEEDEPFSTVVHLAGENVADGRWTKAKMERILDSRVIGTRKLVDLLAALDTPPQTLVCASAIGYYGDRGDEILTEASPLGGGFLADVCRQWEAAARGAEKFGCRVVNLRFGMVLSPNGGALHKMLPPFKAGVGGPIGKGEHFMSWVSIRDLCEIAGFAIDNESLTGPINVVAPQAVRNRDFSKTLGEVLNRPAALPVPPFALKLLFGKMAEEMLLTSARVKPQKLLDHGYSFQDQDLAETLSFCVNGG